MKGQIYKFKGYGDYIFPVCVFEEYFYKVEEVYDDISQIDDKTVHKWPDYHVDKWLKIRSLNGNDECYLPDSVLKDRFYKIGDGTNITKDNLDRMYEELNNVVIAVEEVPETGIKKDQIFEVSSDANSDGEIELLLTDKEGNCDWYPGKYFEEYNGVW